MSKTLSPYPLKASILTAIHGARGSEEAWLHAISTQTTPSDQFEVLVVNASGETGYEQILRKFRNGADHLPNIKYHQIPPGGRNEGAISSRCPSGTSALH
jgi:hypothetical protein